MKNKKILKVLALALAFVLVAGIAVGATMAYLTSTTGTVTNTFSVGKVKITLDEAPTNAYGVADTSADRITTGNQYKLVPGQTYTKDPIVHVIEGSEKCYIFVKVENGISALEAADNNIKFQITNSTGNNWGILESGTDYDVYYKIQEAVADDNDDIADEIAANLPVFGQFTLKTDADLSGVDANTKIAITAYAIQYAGFENNPTGAWTAVSAAASAG